MNLISKTPRSRPQGKKCCHPQKGLVTRNPHVKYQFESQSSHCSKVYQQGKSFIRIYRMTERQDKNKLPSIFDLEGIKKVILHVSPTRDSSIKEKKQFMFQLQLSILCVSYVFLLTSNSLFMILHNVTLKRFISYFTR